MAGGWENQGARLRRDGKVAPPIPKGKRVTGFSGRWCDSSSSATPQAVAVQPVLNVVQLMMVMFRGALLFPRFCGGKVVP